VKGVKPRKPIEISVILARSEVRLKRKNVWLTFKAGWGWTPASRLCLASALSLCRYVRKRVLISLSRGRWITTKRKIRRRGPNIQFPWRKGMSEPLSTVNRRSPNVFSGVPSWKAKLYREALYGKLPITLIYGFEPKTMNNRFLWNILKQAENKNKIL